MLKDKNLLEELDYLAAETTLRSSITLKSLEFCNISIKYLLINISLAQPEAEKVLGSGKAWKKSIAE